MLGVEQDGGEKKIKHADGEKRKRCSFPDLKCF